MNKENILKKINNCVKRLYKKDEYLFKHRFCERCLMFRLAYYLQNEFKNHFVDCEFNKMGFKNNIASSKVMQDDETGKLKKIYVDIVIHERNSNTKDNLVCIEIKRTRHPWDKDIKRLKNMTKDVAFVNAGKSYVFDYDLGIFLFLPKNESEKQIISIIDGQEINI